MCDHEDVDCDDCQTAISARADGEDPAVDEGALDDHLGRCARCRSFAAAVEGSRRRFVVRPAPHMPDLSRRVSKLNAVADRAGRWGLVRALLVVVALEVIILSAPSLFDSADHDGRHLGAFTVAYGAALLVVAVRPARARTVLPVSMVLGAALLITAVVDLARGVVPLIDEATHLPELFSVLLVWLLTVPAPHRRSDIAPVSAAAPALRVVREHEAGGEAGDDAGDDAGRHAV